MKLVQNEWMKIWHKKGSWVMLILTVAALFVLLIGTKSLFASEQQNMTWQQEQQASIKQMKEDIASGEYNTMPDSLKSMKEEIELAQYRLDHNLQPVTSNSTVGFINNSSSLITFVSLFSIIVAATITSFEFGSGTIKMLLTRPISRWKILLSKLLTTLIFSISLGVVTYVLAIALGYIFFNSSAVNLEFVNGQIVQTNIFTESLSSYALSYPDIIISILFAFMIGTVFNSSSLAIGLTLFFTLGSSILVVALANFKIIKYFWFSVSNLKAIIEKTYFIKDVTLPFAITVLSVYAILFLVISFWKFMRQDIKS